MRSEDVVHEEVAQLLGAYAVDAVDAEERAVVERHLGHCPRCRAEVDAHVEMAAALGNAVETPPPHLWDRIADRMATSERSASARSMPDLGAALSASTPSEGPEPAAGDELARARSAKAAGSHRALLALVAVAAAAVVVITILAVNLSRVDNRVGQIQSAVGGQSSQAVITQAFADPNHRLASLTSSSGTKLAEFVVLPDGRGYLVHSAMPALPRTETYQLWGFIAGKPISLGLLGRHPAQAGFTASSAPAPTELAVTVEPAGGVASPDRSPVAAGPILPA